MFSFQAIKTITTGDGGMLILKDHDIVPKAERIKLRDLAYHAEVGASFIAYDIDDLPEPAPLALKAQPGVKLLAWTVRTPEQRDRACRYADAIIFEGFEP